MEKTRKDKLREAGIKKYGSEDNWRQAMREYGSRADKTTPRGFATMDKEKAKEISRKGAHARWNKEKTNEA